MRDFVEDPVVRRRRGRSVRGRRFGLFRWRWRAGTTGFANESPTPQGIGRVEVERLQIER